MVLRLHQHSIGYTGDSFYRSEDPTNSIKVLKEHRDYTINKKYNKHTKKQNTANPLVYNTMGWLGDGSHRGQGCQAWMVVGPLPRYPHRIYVKNLLEH